MSAILQRSEYEMTSLSSQFEEQQQSFSSLKKVVWPSPSPNHVNTEASNVLEERHKHKFNSAFNGTHPVNKPLDWIRQEQEQRGTRNKLVSSQRLEQQQEMEIQKRTWEVHMSNHKHINRPSSRQGVINQ